ncbi:hypothetical protein [Vibrio parahaemolyticus]|uniref:hypothetical protein n=1 Tax=Vibrio parahaemolyticus TaxID=670 RepID=UPI000AF24D3C|nr:hypothetical protein [Vibrio parahaemolyticus]
MSSIKEYIFDLEEQAKSDWIQEKLGDFDADESSPGWSELGLCFLNQGTNSLTDDLIS